MEGEAACKWQSQGKGPAVSGLSRGASFPRGGSLLKLAEYELSEWALGSHWPVPIDRSLERRGEGAGDSSSSPSFANTQFHSRGVCRRAV